MKITFWKAKPNHRIGDTPSESNATHLAIVRAGHSLNSDFQPSFAIRWFLTAIAPTTTLYDWTIIRDRPGHIRCYLDHNPTKIYLLHVASPVEKNLAQLLPDSTTSHTTKHKEDLA